ncbi:Mitochondrial distribution and morphology protein 12 [Coemansia sp. RSA 552]|nr:Mitochondrial distribution and morphology protein 12 [Coemansia sp. RSA 552]
MSFTIYWEKLDRRVAESVQEQLNSFFAGLEPRPAFLGQITVEELDFGSVAPYLEILDLTEPFAEFYLATEDDVSNAASRTNLQDYAGVDEDAGVSESGRVSRATMQSRLGVRMDMLTGSGMATPGARVWSGRPLYRTPSLESVVCAGQVMVPRGEDDMQLAARVQYHGDMALRLRTELQLNYPATQFASLPVTLHITKIEFSATAVVAYMVDRVNFCFLEPEPPRTSLLDSFAIRTEIGDADQHVLKNVEKLECFITEQLRRAIDDGFVFPSYHSFEHGE